MELKFRAWDKLKNKMYGQELIQNIDLIDGHIELIYENTYLVLDIDDEVELMQFTGLKDKNGVEIYEGDIVKDKFGQLYNIIWFQPWACFVMSMDNYIENIQTALETERLETIDTIFNSDTKYNGWEVIGNKYENTPECNVGDAHEKNNS